MGEFKVVNEEYLEKYKDTNFYEFKKNPKFEGYTDFNPTEPEYLGKYIDRTTGGARNNYYFIYNFEKKILISGDVPTLYEYVLRIVEEKKTGGKKIRRTRKNKKSKKSKKSKRTTNRRRK